MAAGRSTLATAAIPGFDLEEVINESGPRAIYGARRQADGVGVILKTLIAQYPTKGEVAELRREYQITARLRLDGVIRVHSLVPHGYGNLAIEMEPFGRSLADHMVTNEGDLDDLAREFERLLSRLNRG